MRWVRGRARKRGEARLTEALDLAVGCKVLFGVETHGDEEVDEGTRQGVDGRCAIARRRQRERRGRHGRNSLLSGYWATERDWRAGKLSVHHKQVPASFPSLLRQAIGREMNEAKMQASVRVRAFPQ